MEIFIAKQPMQVSRFKAWLLRKLDVHYELSEEALDIIDAINTDPTIPNVDELKSEEVMPTIIEADEEPKPWDTPVGPSSYVLHMAMRKLSTRAYNMITVALEDKGLRASKMTVADFYDKITELDLLKVKGCGKVTVAEIREWLAEYELELRKDDTI